MYLVLSFGIHNFKVQKAWEARDAEAQKLQDSYNQFKNDCLDPEWLNDVEKKVRGSKPGQEVLVSAMRERFGTFDPTLRKEETKKEEVPIPVVPAASTGSAPVGIAVNKSSSGKVI